jgi:hypothetical protein
MSLEIREGE